VWCSDPGPGPSWGANPGVCDGEWNEGESALIVFMSVCTALCIYVCMYVHMYLYECVLLFT
jgi:hypothetical protein